MLHDINRVFNAVGFTWENQHWKFKITEDGNFLQGYYSAATSPLVNVGIEGEPAVAAAKFVIAVANSPLSRETRHTSLNEYNALRSTQPLGYVNLNPHNTQCEL